MNVLNPELYNRLIRRFTRVRINNQGQANTVVHQRVRWKGRLRQMPQVREHGERYYINCPLCGDTRGRCAINHAWGEKDLKSRMRMLSLIKCYNEDCFVQHDARQSFYSELFPKGTARRPPGLTARAVPTMATDIRQPPPANLPEATDLEGLSPDHPAIRYLTDRGYDPKALARTYQVGYCEQWYGSRPNFEDGRIVIPIFHPAHPLITRDLRTDDLRLVGWQARTIDPKPGKRTPKYLSALGMRKSQILYGLPQAARSQKLLVLVEGITDVWRVGTQAVALLGKTLSAYQLRLIRKRFADRTIVIMLDADAEDDARRMRDQLCSADGNLSLDGSVHIAAIPAHCGDPADCTANEIDLALRGAVAAG